MARKYWYKYIGPWGGEAAISNYTLSPNGSGCFNGSKICKIYALYGGDIHPLSLSTHILEYIPQAKIDEVGYPRFGLKVVLVEQP